jgi:hypothetical protein
MKKHDPAYFHKLYGAHKPRVQYYARDCFDYTLMVLLTAVVVLLCYRTSLVLSIFGLFLCVSEIVMFPLRHGFELKVPLILRRPQDVLYTFLYKLENLTPVYFIAIALLLLENYVVSRTPNLPHHVELLRKIFLVLFWVHFLVITGYRTAILFAHLAKKEFAREVLMETPWKRTINQKTNITLEIFHAYFTGLLTHLVLVGPCYLVITYANFSLVFLPVICAINVWVHYKWVKATNEWFYRDHWLGHNSELEFIYLHGTHHDAIPCGLIGVAGNGFLEGFMRGTIGFPIPFYNPIIALLVYSVEIRQDMALHQYIPGIFPKMPKQAVEIGQHSTHHYGRLEPYTIALKLDQPGVSEEYKKNFSVYPDELMNSIRLDEELTDFEWDNPTHQATLALWDKYQK